MQVQIAQRPVFVAGQRRALAGSALPVAPRVNICRPCRFKENDNQDKVQKTLEKISEKTDEATQDFSEQLRNVSSKPQYAETTPKVNIFQPAFTRRREVFSGRLAMIGFLAACLGEVYMDGHPNIMQQIASPFNLAGIPIGPGAVAALLFGLVLYNGLGAVAPWSPTFSEDNQRDVARRPEGPTQTPVTPFNIKKFFGISGWGFTKANELFVGRLAMLGFAAALIFQLRLGGVYGPGPLGQIAHWLSIPTDTAYYAGIPTFIFGFGVLCAVVGYLTGKPGSTQGEEDIY